MKTYLFCLALLSVATGCKIFNRGGGAGGSETSSINMQLPNKTSLDTKVRDLITQFELKMIPSGCSNGKRIERTSSYDSATISDKITQGCSYAIGLRLMDANGTDAYYGNWETSVESEGKQLSSAEFLGKPSVNISVLLRPLKAAKDKGVDPNGTIPTPGDTDANLCVEIEGQPNPDCKDGTPIPGGGGGGAVTGACKKEDGLWKTRLGGCQHQVTGHVVSSISNHNGTARKITPAERGNYCNQLNEGGFSDWKLPSESTLQSMGGSVLLAYLQIHNIQDHILQVWTSDTVVVRGETMNVIETIQNSNVRRNEYETNYSSLTTEFYQFCVRR